MKAALLGVLGIYTNARIFHCSAKMHIYVLQTRHEQKIIFEANVSVNVFPDLNVNANID